MLSELNTNLHCGVLVFAKQDFGERIAKKETRM
jgi:hypothetical protein